MIYIRKILVFCLLSGGFVVLSPLFSASAQTSSDLSGSALADRFRDTELAFEADLNVLAALGDSFARHHGPYVDVRFKGESESLTDQGWRYGASVQVRANNAGRRGNFTAPLPDHSSQAAKIIVGASTGLHGSGAHIWLDQAELYFRTQWFRTRLGLGKTAHMLEQSDLLQGLRWSVTQDARRDPSGLNLAHTGSSLADGAPTISVQSRRILGVRLAASYAPDVDLCDLGCQPSLPSTIHADLESVWSLAGSFSRRSPRSGVKWDLVLGLEQASVSDAASPVFDHPWFVFATAVRQGGDVTLHVSALTGEDGFESAGRSSLSSGVSVERNDWTWAAEMARGDSDFVKASSQSARIGGFRFVGERGVAGLSLLYVRQYQDLADRDSTQLLFEFGLRF